MLIRNRQFGVEPFPFTQRWDRYGSPTPFARGKRAGTLGDFYPTQRVDRFGAIRWPGEIRDEQKTVDGLVRALGNQITNSNLDASFKSTWGAFRMEWDKFFSDHDGIFSNLSIADWDKTEEYRQRVADWRQVFADELVKRGQGLTVAGPSQPKSQAQIAADTKAKEDAAHPPTDWGNLAKWALILGGGALALNAVGKLSAAGGLVKSGRKLLMG